jgi:hypothetical protein
LNFDKLSYTKREAQLVSRRRRELGVGLEVFFFEEVHGPVPILTAPHFGEGVDLAICMEEFAIFRRTIGADRKSGLDTLRAVNWVS